MLDVVAVAIVIVFFAGMAAYVIGSEKIIRGRRDGAAPDVTAGQSGGISNAHAQPGEDLAALCVNSPDLPICTTAARVLLGQGDEQASRR